MYDLKSAFIVAGIVAGGSCATAFADDSYKLETSNMPAVFLQGDEYTNFQRIQLKEKIFNDGRVIQSHAFIDRVIGVTCEWKEKSRRVVDEAGAETLVDTRREFGGCVKSIETPAMWRKSSQVESQYDYESESSLIQDSDKFNMLYGVVDFSNLDGSSFSRFKHIWDISAQTVCLETSEAKRDGRGLDHSYFTHRWGCYPAASIEAFETVIEAAGISPPL